MTFFQKTQRALLLFISVFTLNTSNCLEAKVANPSKISSISSTTKSSPKSELTLIEQQQLLAALDKLSQEVKNIRMELVYVKQKLSYITNTSQKIAVFNKGELIQEIMEKDINELEEFKVEQENIWRQKQQDLKQFDDTFQSQRSSLTQELVKDRQDKIRSLSLSLQNLKLKIDKEVEDREKEIRTRFSRIVNNSLSIILKKNPNYTFIFSSNEDLIFPANSTRWPLEIVNIKKELIVLCKKTYYARVKK